MSLKYEPASEPLHIHVSRATGAADAPIPPRNRCTFLWSSRLGLADLCSALVSVNSRASTFTVTCHPFFGTDRTLDSAVAGRTCGTAAPCGRVVPSPEEPSPRQVKRTLDSAVAGRLLAAALRGWHTHAITASATLEAKEAGYMRLVHGALLSWRAYAAGRAIRRRVREAVCDRYFEALLRRCLRVFATHLVRRLAADEVTVLS